MGYKGWNYKRSISNYMRVLLLLSFLICLPSAVFAARQSPVDKGVVTSGVGYRVDPFGSGRMTYHNGYDIAVPVGTPVYPTQVGTVYFAGPHRGYGNLVAVQHGEGYVSFYGHNSSILVTPGQYVDTSTAIALSGNSGRSTGPHVHYEIRQIPGYAKQQREQLTRELKVAVKNRIDGWAEGVAEGRGGPETEVYLPTDGLE